MWHRLCGTLMWISNSGRLACCCWISMRQGRHGQTTSLGAFFQFWLSQKSFLLGQRSRALVLPLDGEWPWKIYNLFSSRQKDVMPRNRNSRSIDFGWFWYLNMKGTQFGEPSMNRTPQVETPSIVIRGSTWALPSMKRHPQTPRWRDLTRSYCKILQVDTSGMSWWWVD